MKVTDFIYIALILGLAGGLFWVHQSQPKVGYVHTFQLLENYKGMQEAAQLFEKKRTGWAQTLDSLQREHQVAVDTYLKMQAGLSDEERAEREARLGHSQQTVQQFQKAVEQKAQDDDASMTEGVLVQVSDFISDYGKTHGYTVILGTSQEGNILYGNEGHNLTEELTEALNLQYSGKAE